MGNSLRAFVKNYLSYIDNGHLFRKPFSWLYGLLAIINLAFPVYIGYQAWSFGLLRLVARDRVVFVLVWIIVAIVSWLSFQLWWDRKTKVTTTSTEGDEFVATPVFSHLIQTLGEWLGTWLAIVGFTVALFTLILGDDTQVLWVLGLGFIEADASYIVLWPVYGFLIIVVTRFLAEQFRALSSIANNTRKN